jgi:hypothetical protein
MDPNVTIIYPCSLLVTSSLSYKRTFPLANFGPVLSSAVTTKANKNLFLPSFVAALD